MKVSIVGGGGRVGSTVAFALQQAGIVHEIAIVDTAQDAAAGEALDLRHGVPLSSAQRILSGDYEAAAGSDMVIITASLRRKPDESRLELISRNVTLFREIAKSLRSVRLARDAVLLVVTNPVDILTQLLLKELDVEWTRVIGLGTLLDTCRFRSALAEYFDVAPSDVRALVLGERGDTMVPIWSSANINGVALRSFPGYTADQMAELFERTKASAADLLRMKGGAAWAIGASVRKVVGAVAHDESAVLPVSVLQQGALGVKGVCLSMPTVIGLRGVSRVIEPVVDKSEAQLLRKSAAALAEIVAKVL
jgi:L-lactate dehydrogenase